MITPVKLILYFIVSVGFHMPASLAGTAPIRYFNTATVSLKGEKTILHILPIDDHGLRDTLYEIRSSQGYPTSFFQTVRTSVCYDNKCRLLVTVLHWNITGRYLGFEIPEGEFLSKAEHDPFKTADYARLHAILSDENSPLRNFAYEDLSPRIDMEKEGVNAVTSATSKDVANDVVEGAAYTTYTLWHILYGSRQKEVMSLTRKSLTDDLLLHILQSADRSDKVWALNQVNTVVGVSSTIQKEIVNLVNNSDFHLSEKAIQVMDSAALESDTLQLLLLAKYQNVNYNLKNTIVTKLKKVSVLHSRVKSELTNDLRSSQGILFVNTLELFKGLKFSDEETIRVVAGLLNDQNRFRAQKSFEFLTAQEKRNSITEEAIRMYRLKYGVR